MARDNFSKSVIDRLKARVAHRCSNPDCRVATSAPSGDDGVNSIGVAAHISAASPGGPRYDASMSSKQRASINNAIWLCANCSIDIDKDLGRYPVSLLTEWKNKAEAAARIELGNKQPKNNDAIDTVSMALTGFPKSYISTAISNVHRASQKTLEELDPRFLIETSYESGITSIGIYAREDIKCAMRVNVGYAKQYMEKYQQLLDHGKDLEMDLNAVNIEGSKLLEEIFGSVNGTLVISSRKISATQKLWVIQDGTNVVESFDDVQGLISVGAKTFTFEGAACSNIFSFCYQRPLEEKDDKTIINMSVCFEKWEGVDVRFLPYFDKLYSLYTKMSEGWRLFTSLEVTGIRVLLSKAIDARKSDHIRETAAFLNYINCSRRIAASFNLNVKFTKSHSLSLDEYNEICDVAEILTGYQRKTLQSNAMCNLMVTKGCENVKRLARIDQATSFTYVQNEGDDISIFGKRITLPPKIVVLNGVIPKIGENIESLKEGDMVKVELVPQSNFGLEIKYDSQNGFQKTST